MEMGYSFKKIAISLTALIILIFLWENRWTYKQKFTLDKGEYVEIIKKDNWTNQIWVEEYRSDSSTTYKAKYGEEKPVDEDYNISPYLLRNILTYSWFIIAAVSLYNSILSVILLLKSKSPSN